MNNYNTKKNIATLSLLFSLTGCTAFSQDLPAKKRDRVLYTGIINIVPDNFKFPLFGFINIAKGSQKNLSLGFVNITGSDTKGVQIGFVNTSKTLKGLQLGFFNYAASAEKGIPVGLLSFVKNGGYKAVKIGITEMYPLNLSFDIGVKKFYTTISGSYNGALLNKYAVGFGIGSIIDINKNIYFNPEAIIQATDVDDIKNNRLLSIRPQFGIKISSTLDVLCGPSLVWQNAVAPSALHKPFYSIYKHASDSKNNLLGGANISLKLHLSK